MPAADQHGNLLLTVLLGTGGLGLGLQFSTLISHLTTTVPGDYAPDISGVATTAMQIGGALSMAAIGTLYLSLAAHPGPGHATHAYAITTVCSVRVRGARVRFLARSSLRIAATRMARMTTAAAERKTATAVSVIANVMASRTGRVTFFRNWRMPPGSLLRLISSWQ